METLSGVWNRTVRRAPHALALIGSDGRQWTRKELAAHADAWVQALPAGAAAMLRGRAVVFSAPNGAEWFAIFLGLLATGAVPAALDPHEPAEAQRAMAATLRAAASWRDGKLELVAGHRPRRYDAEIALLKVTSGSTGAPRALAFTAANMLADGRNICATMGIGPRDLNLAAIPLGHSYGLGNLVIPLLAQGTALACAASPLPQALAADFARWRPTVFPGVPAMWRALATAEIPPAALASLRTGISAGAPLPPEVARDFAARFGKLLHSFYGSSETGGITYDRTGAAAVSGGVGRALRGVQLNVLPGKKLEVSSGAVFTRGNRRRAGELGAWIMPDRVKSDAKGNLVLLGRRGRTVKIAGRRVDPGEIAARLRRLEGVSEVWVGASAGAEPVLGAAVASTKTKLALRAELQADTAAWKVPKKWLVLPALPLTARGKIDTAELRRQLFG